MLFTPSLGDDVSSIGRRKVEMDGILEHPWILASHKPEAEWDSDMITMWKVRAEVTRAWA